MKSSDWARVLVCSMGAFSMLLFSVSLATTSAHAADYRVALPGHQYRFPRDHFDHPEYQTEWWYYTGNLRAADGHRFGFELTFFRQGVARDANLSPWHIRDLYMAHLALSDIGGRRFYETERLNRAGPGIAGASESAGLIWNGNWQARFEPHGESHVEQPNNRQEQELRGIGDQFEFNLKLRSETPPVIHGRDGISQKAEGVGHASHYISFPRLQTSGTIVLDGKTYQADGTSWMDHEFFTESMDSNESGWDWLSLQLDDKTELMLYRLRHKDGSVDPYSSGTYIDANGKSSFLASTDFTMRPAGETWTSPKSKATYPIRWQVAIPKLSLQLDVTTPLAGQELVSAIGPSYWEGAIDIAGQRTGSPLRGVGYLEMTGYGKAPVLPLARDSR